MLLPYGDTGIKKPAEVIPPAGPILSSFVRTELLSYYGVGNYGVSSYAVANAVADAVGSLSLLSLLTAGSEADSSKSHEHEN